MNWFNIRLIFLANLSPESRKKFEKTVDLVHDLGQRIHKQFTFIEKMISVIMLIILFFIIYWLIFFTLSFI